LIRKKAFGFEKTSNFFKSQLKERAGGQPSS
jgi:hypothetical protein